MEKQCENEFVKKILSKIDKLRIQKGFTVYRLTELSGLSENTIYNWYNRNAIPTIAALNTICSILEISLSELFAKDDGEAMSYQHRLLISEFAQLTSNQQKIVLDLIHEFKNSKE